MVSLDPDSFVCPEHHQNLTPAVAQQLEEAGTPVVYARKGKRRPFMVIVTCPGDSGAGDEHQVACQGSYRR